MNGAGIPFELLFHCCDECGSYAIVLLQDELRCQLHSTCTGVNSVANSLILFHTTFKHTYINIEEDIGK